MKMFNPHTECLDGAGAEQLSAAMDERESCQRDDLGRRTVKLSHDWGCWHDQAVSPTAHLRPSARNG